MIGHGSAFKGGDKDPVALLGKATGVTTTNEDIYSVPPISDPDKAIAFAKELDAKDGKRDDRWRGHPLNTHEQIHYTPATADYEEWLLERLVRWNRFGADRVSDLLYVNFKTTDIAGHKWGMNSPEVGEIFTAQDENLRRFVNFLDRRVGQGRWVLMLTADHGQMPYPRESGAWPIYGGELARDMNAVFDKTKDDINLISSVGAAGIYVRLDQLQANDASLWKMARWVAGYTIRENLKQGETMPARFEGRGDELLMDAVLVKNKLAAVACRRA
jgi:predicted AlkP superfamily pyrophosphatase or phosphodiesterase